MIRVALGGVLLAATMTSVAVAADLIVEEPIAEALAAAHDWSGAYVGVHVGGVAGTVDAPWGSLDGPLTSGNDPFDISGWLAGVHAGVNFQSGSFVGSLEALADWAPFSGDDGGDGGDINGLDGKFIGTLGGRVGFAADSTLFYLSGGAAVLTADGLVLNAGREATIDATFFGGTVGAGVEIAFDENVSGRLDYRYYTFAQQAVSFRDNLYDIGFTPSFHAITAGISVGF